MFGRLPKHWKRIVIPSVVLSTAVAVQYNTQFVEFQTSNLVIGSTLRSLRDIATTIRMIADYKHSLYYTNYEQDPEAYYRVLEEAHERNAHRLLTLFRKNSGIYIKLGQMIAQLQHLLPDVYVRVMSECCSDAPTRDIEDVRRVIEEDLHVRLEDAFPYFNETPIASASLAQVHQAVNRAGERVAVKVQHRGLREMCEMDFITIAALVKLSNALFPDLKIAWLLRLAEENLPVELDFMNEARNAEKCREMVKNIHHARVPRIDYQMSTSRVLCMEFVDGVSVVDLEEIQRRRISPARISQVVANVFCSMIFLHRFVHCDPHHGNFLVTGEGSNWELWILDHGLYQSYSKEFQELYSKLWKSIFLTDQLKIEHYARLLDVENPRLFASMLTARPWHVISTDSTNIFSDIQYNEASKSHIQSSAVARWREVVGTLSSMPTGLLFLLKTNDCLRSIDRSLGNSYNSFKVTARYAFRTCRSASLWARLKEWVQLETRIFVFNAIRLWNSLINKENA